MFLKKLLTCFLLCVFSLHALQAQRRQTWKDDREIATDFNNCTVGVKDSLGNWIIQPKYEHIVPHYDRYIVTSGGKYGLLDYSGNEMIPLMYDYIYMATTWSQLCDGLGGYYLVTQDRHLGIVDSVNHTIVPIHYNVIHTNIDSTFTCRTGKRTYDLYNINGTCFHAPWKSKSFPNYEARHLISIQKRTLFGWKVGAIDDSAHIIFPQKYDDIDGYDETSSIRLQKDGRYGFCSLGAKWIWPMTFQEDINYWFFDDVYRLLGRNGVGPAFVNGHWGLVNIKGDTLLPFIYTAIYPLDEEGESDLWQVDMDSLSGIYDTKNGWVLKPESSALYTMETFRTSDSGSVALLLAQQGGKWGALTTSGQIVIPFGFDQFVLRGKEIVFMKGDSLYYLGSNGESERSQLIRKVTGGRPSIYFDLELDFLYLSETERAVPDSKTFSVYSGHNGVRAYYNPSMAHDSVVRDSVSYSLHTGKTYGMMVPDSIITSALFYVIPVTRPQLHTELFDIYSAPQLTDEDSITNADISFIVMHTNEKPLLTYSIQEINPDNGSRFLITGEQELLNVNGKLIYSGNATRSIEDHYHGHDGSLYFSVETYDERMCAIDTNGNTLIPFAKSRIADFSNKYSWRCTYGEYSKWSLINNQTQASLLGKKVYSDNPYPIWDSITIVENEKTGRRLYNITRNTYLTTYGFNKIFPLSQSGNLFGVKTCSEHVGVIDASGKFILDTIYEAYTPVDYDTTIQSSNYITQEYYNKFYDHHVFYNANTSVMLESSTGHIVAPQDRLNLLWSEFATVIDSDSLQELLYDSFYVYNNYDKTISLFLSRRDSAALLPWQRQCIADTLYAPVRIFSPYSRSYNYPCRYCVVRGAGYEAVGLQKNYNNYGADFILDYRSDSVLSFTRIVRSYSWNTEFERSWFSNVMMFPDGAHQMTLDSLFNPSSDWRNMIINTVITYVNTHMGITGDCHNPAGIPTLLNERFQITPEGLKLFPRDFEENGVQLVLTLPWKDVDSYLRNDVRTRLPINEK